MNKDIFDFSLNDLKIEEHRDIEQELSKDPVLQAMYEKIYSTKIQEFCQFMLDQAFPIPRGISMKADQLCSRFKEHLPGDYGLELLTLGDMVPEPSNQQQTALARFFAGKHFAMIEEDPDSERSILKVCLGAEALQNRSEEELLFLMGHAAARVTDECPPYHLMLKMASPIGFDQQLLISRLLRFQTTTAACLGLMACRSLDAAKQSLFKLETGINPGLIGVDYDKLSDCQDGKMSERALIGLDYPAFTADPLYFYALEQLKKPLCEDWVIDETEWENYSKAISKANERFHPKLKEMPEEDRHFRERFKILCMHAVADADEKLQEEEKQVILESCDKEILKELEEEDGWEKGPDGNTIRKLKATWFFTPHTMLFRHAAEIMFDCIRIALSDRKFTEEEKEAVFGIAENVFGLDFVDYEAIYDAVCQQVGFSEDDEEGCEDDEEGYEDEEVEEEEEALTL